MSTSGLTNAYTAEQLKRCITACDSDRGQDFIVATEGVYLGDLCHQLLATMQREADLQHDIERHLAICTELATENQQLRSLIMHFILAMQAASETLGEGIAALDLQSNYPAPNPEPTEREV